MTFLLKMKQKRKQMNGFLLKIISEIPEEQIEKQNEKEIILEGNQTRRIK